MSLRWKTKLEGTVTKLLGQNLEYWREKGGVWIAGGAAKGYVLNEKYSDIDFMFASEAHYKEFSLMLANLSGCVMTKRRSDLREFQCNDVVVQLCAYAFYETPEAVIDDFDFTLCKVALDLNFNATYSKEDYNDAIDKVLRAHRLRYPVVVFRRIDKFIQKGYEPHPKFWEELVAQLKEIENPLQQLNVGKPIH